MSSYQCTNHDVYYRDVLTVIGFVTANRQFLTPHRISVPEPITKKLVQVTMSTTLTPVQNLVQICPRENVLNITRMFYLCPFLLRNSPTGQIIQQTFMRHGLTHVPFEV